MGSPPALCSASPIGGVCHISTPPPHTAPTSSSLCRQVLSRHLLWHKQDDRQHPALMAARDLEGWQALGGCCSVTQLSPTGIFIALLLRFDIR